MTTVANNSGKKLLAIIRHSPYGDSLARTSIETALAASAFDQSVCLLFLGDGVLQLMPDQEPSALGSRNLGRLLASLPLYDIESVYVDAQAVSRYRVKLENTPVSAVPLQPPEMVELLREHDLLLGF